MSDKHCCIVWLNRMDKLFELVFSTGRASIECWDYSSRITQTEKQQGQEALCFKWKKYNLVAYSYCSPRPQKVRVALTHVTGEWSHIVRVAHSTSNTCPPLIVLICGRLLHAIRAWHQSIHHCVTARCLHSDTDITLQRVGVEQASFHASPAYCSECNLSLVWVMMAVKSSSQPLHADVLFFLDFWQIAFKTVYSIAWQ